MHAPTQAHPPIARTRKRPHGRTHVRLCMSTSLSLREQCIDRSKYTALSVRACVHAHPHGSRRAHMRTPIARVPAHRSTHTYTHIDRTTPRCIVGHAHNVPISTGARSKVCLQACTRVLIATYFVYMCHVSDACGYKFILTTRARPCKRPHRRTNAHAGACARRQTYTPMDASKRTRRFLFFSEGYMHTHTFAGALRMRMRTRGCV